MRGRYLDKLVQRLIVLVACTGLLVQIAEPLLTSKASAQEPDWFDADSLTLEALKDHIPSAELPYSTSNNRDCIQRTFVTRPKRIMLQWPYYQSEQSKQGCAIEARYGLIDEQGYFQRSNTGVAGTIKTVQGGNAVVTAIPGSDDMVLHSSSGAPYAMSYHYVYRNVADSLKTVAATNGSITHHLTDAPGLAIRDNADRLVGINGESRSYSPDGKWMVADVSGMGLSRIDMESLHIQPFARLPIGYGSGSNPAWNTAISPTGRYVAVASASFTIFRLYDLYTCAKATLDMHEQCQYVDLRQYMIQNVPGHSSVFRLRFMSDGDLDFYGMRTATEERIYTHYSLHLPGSATGFGYLGLGDSFSSGEGAYAYRDGTDTPDNRCHLSTQSYPYLVGVDSGFAQYNSVACSGAKTSHLKDNSEGVQAKQPNGLPTSEQAIAQMLPGYLPQTDFVRQYNPQAVTLTAGGNDVGFADIISRCISYDTCYQYREEREQLLDLIDRQFDTLVGLYNDLQQAGGRDRMRVYVLGYPQLAYPEGNCAANVHLNKGELYFANELVEYLNGVIRAATEKAGVLYVDVEEAFAGHRFCEAGSWSIAVNGLTAGDDIPSFFHGLGPFGKESYHPNAFGHELFARTVRQQTVNLTRPMPSAQPDLVYEPDRSQLPIIVNAPSASPDYAHSLHNTKLHVYDAGTGVLTKGQATELSGLGESQALVPNQDYQVELHSDPIQLGTFTTDSDGKLTAMVSVPNTTPTGIHTLHITGKNIAGEDIDIFRTVYVIDEAEQGQCVVVPDLGQDQDGDGIDDACDGFIGEAPSAEKPVEMPEDSVRSGDSPDIPNNLATEQLDEDAQPLMLAQTRGLHVPRQASESFVATSSPSLHVLGEDARSVGRGVSGMTQARVGDGSSEAKMRLAVLVASVAGYLLILVAQRRRTPG